MTDRPFEFSGAFGESYDTLIRKVVFGYDSIFLMALSLLDRSLGDQASVLIAGSGTGAEVTTFGRRRPGWRFTGVDPSAEMIQIARIKVTEQGIRDRATFHQGYVADLPIDERFDAATLMLVLQFVADDGQKLALLKSIGERLKPGAPFVLVDLYGDPASEQFQYFVAAWKDYQALMGIQPEIADGLFEDAVQTQHFISEGRTLELLAQAGFKDVRRFYTAFLHGGWIAKRA